MIKHADAKEIHVKFVRQPDLLVINVRDDGIGFELLSVQRGLGLLGMQERVESMNGTFEIKSGIDQGVNIDILIPLKNNEDTEKSETKND